MSDTLVLAVPSKGRLMDQTASLFTSAGLTLRKVGSELSFTLPAETDIDAWLAGARDKGAKLVSVTPRHETLEDLFLREIANADKSSAATEGRV